MKDSSDAFNLAGQLGEFGKNPDKLPPIQDWNPELSGHMDMIIKADGTWVHEGGIIKRKPLVKLFSSILKKEGHDYFLVTPVEKWRIQVEVTPFIITLAQVVTQASSQSICLMTNVGEEITLNEARKLQVLDEKVPYIEVRHGLNAQLSRNVYYQLAELAHENANGQFTFSSDGSEQRIG
jgi:hypothetical protein